MKLSKLLLLALLLPYYIFAHGGGVPVKEGKVKMGKTKLWCFIAEYPYDKAITVETIEKDIQGANIKRTSRKKGFSIYRGVSWHTFSNNKGDYYYKVKNKKGKTTLYFCASKGYDNYVTSTNDAETTTKITNFLHELSHKIETAKAILEKESELKTIEKKNAEINKQLEESKKQEAQKTNEIKTLKKMQTAPAPVK
jgi:hypothetical protein